MYQSTYFIDKSSNTFADSLAAFGLAFVFDVLVDGRASISLEDQGYCYTLRCQPVLQPEWVQHSRFFTGAPLLQTLDKNSGSKIVKGTTLTAADLPEPGDMLVDYQAEKVNNERYFDWLKGLPQDERRSLARGEYAGPRPASPHPDWDVFRVINPAALQGYNALMAEWWRGQAAFKDLLEILLQMTTVFPNDVAGAEAAWNSQCKARQWPKKEATLMQIYNPTQGKGGNSLKTAWSAPGNVKGFWLLEWLKAVGLYAGGITKTIRNTKDRKTYVLAPFRLDWNLHKQVMARFRQVVRSESAVKLDVMTALRYTQVLLEHYEAARGEDPLAALFGYAPGDLVSGMQMAFYKDMGNALATMNIAAINLPRWVAPCSAEDLVLFQQSLTEHIRIIANLDESRGDQFNLLKAYRDFLSASDLDPFFEFTAAYSGFLISQRERGKPVRQFTTTTLEVLFMNSDHQGQSYSRILKDDGFCNIAYAIRHSTVIPQTIKGRGGKPPVDIRYGLGQQLTRKAVYPSDFLAELTEFIQLYNAENAQLREKKRHPMRKDLTTRDIESLTALVDEFGSKLICNMLVAYGYARQAASEQETEAPAEELGLEEPEVGEVTEEEE